MSFRTTFLGVEVLSQSHILSPEDIIRSHIMSIQTLNRISNYHFDNSETPLVIKVQRLAPKWTFFGAHCPLLWPGIEIEPPYLPTPGSGANVVTAKC